MSVVQLQRFFWWYRKSCLSNYFSEFTGEIGSLGTPSLLGDGDTHTISHVYLSKPYGPGVSIAKETCVGHVAKSFYKSHYECMA